MRFSTLLGDRAEDEKRHEYHTRSYTADVFVGMAFDAHRRYDKVYRSRADLFARLAKKTERRTFAFNCSINFLVHESILDLWRFVESTLVQRERTRPDVSFPAFRFRGCF